MSQSIRDKIRSATIGQNTPFRSEVVTYNGVEVELRQPSVRARKELFSRCKDAEGNVDFMDFIVWSVIYNTYVPGTQELVFIPEDYEALVDKPTDGFVDQFGDKVAKLMNVEDDERKK